MKARMELVFYLPYRLPRESASWGTEFLFAEINGLQVGIAALPPGAADRAPKSIDGLAIQTLSDEGAPIRDDAFQSQPILNHYSHFYEAVAAISIGDLSKDIPTDEERQKFINAGIAAASKFIQICKVLSRDDLLFFNVSPVTAPQFHLDAFPYSENWYADSSDQLLDAPDLNLTYSKSVGLRHGMNPVSWERISAAYRSGDQPRIDILLLLESRSAYMNADDRKAVLFAAMASEISAFVLAERKLLDRKFRQQLHSMDLPVWEKLFDAFPKAMGLPSLKDQDPTLFTELSLLFRVRNKIAHEGLCYVERDSSKQPILLTRSRIWNLVSAAEKAIDWTTSL
jgi:hypothetical protein